MTTVTQLITPNLEGNSIEQKRAELKAYLKNSWQTYESLFALINNDDAYYLRPEPLRHPLIFYYGHTAVFYINKLILGKYIDKRINPKLEAICAVGVDEMSWDDLNSEHYDWPSVDEVRAYRKQVLHLLETMIDEMELSLPITQDSLAWVILMGAEHERIHIETSSVIMRMLDLQYLDCHSECWSSCETCAEAPENELLAVSGKTQLLGKSADDKTYGWDNEYGSLLVEVADFKAAKYLVSNQEFLAFVKAGGYQNSQWWTAEGQQWLAYTKAEMPRFWLKKGEQFFQRNLLNEVPLPLNWPVEVNYLEAKAFCNWLAETTGKFIRLPTEAEWTCLRDTLAGDITSWQQINANINLAHYASSCPVNEFAHGDFYDLVGNVWQWTESAIDGFNGFSVHPLYDDFSTPTFDGRHNLFKGGSWISTGNEAIKSSRYAFRRHFFQHAGFRYIEAQTAELPITPVNEYETNLDVCLQLNAEYNTKEQPNYFHSLANCVLNLVEQFSIGQQKLLDIGCGTGRVSFELAPHFNWIDAVDFSARFIQHGFKAQQGEKLRFIQPVEGDIVDFVENDLSQFGLTKTDNILFSQGDPCNLKAVFSEYDCILAQQVLERSYQPALFLKSVAERVKMHGFFILISDYQFDQTITPKQHWLSGIKVNGENVLGIDGVTAYLQPNFELVHLESLQQKIALNACHTMQKQLQLSVWQKRH